MSKIHENGIDNVVTQDIMEYVSFTIDCFGTILRSHPLNGNFLGYNQDEFLDKNIFDFIPTTSDGDRLKKIMVGTIDFDSIVDLPMDFVSKDGYVQRFRWSLFPISDKISEQSKFGLVGEPTQRQHSPVTIMKNEDISTLYASKANNNEKTNFVPIDEKASRQDSNEKTLEENISSHSNGKEEVKEAVNNENTSYGDDDSYQKMHIIVQKGRIVYFSEKIPEILGWNPDELNFMSYFRLFTTDGLESVKDFILKRLKDRDNASYRSYLKSMFEDKIEVLVSHHHTQFQDKYAEKIEFSVVG